MLLPPLFEGAFQVTVACPIPAVADTPVGAAGAVTVTVTGGAAGSAVHCANSVTLDEIANVTGPGGAYDVPEPSAAVFQPLKVNPDLASEPTFPSTATVEPPGYAVGSTGTVPPVDAFAAYVTENVGAGIHCEYSVAFPPIENVSAGS